MQTRGVRVDSKAVDVTIGTCSRAGQWQMIIKLFDQMPMLTRNTFVPTEITYTHVISAAWKLNDSSKAVSVLEAMAASGLLPPFASISQVIATLEASSSDEDKERYSHTHMHTNAHTHKHTQTHIHARIYANKHNTNIRTHAITLSLSLTHTQLRLDL